MLSAVGVEVAVEPGAVVADRDAGTPDPAGRRARPGAAGPQAQQGRVAGDVAGRGGDGRTHLGGRPVVAAEQRGRDAAGAGGGDRRAGAEVPATAEVRRRGGAEDADGRSRRRRASRTQPVGSPELVQATSRSGVRCTPSGRSGTRRAGVAAHPRPRRAAVVLGRGGRSARCGSRPSTGPRLVLTSTMPDAVGPRARPRTCRPGRCGRARTRRCARRPGRRRGCPAGRSATAHAVAPAAATRAPSTRRAGRAAVRAAMAPASRSPGATTAPRRVAPVVPPTEVTHGRGVGGVRAGAAVAGRGRRRRRRPRQRRAGRVRRCRRRPGVGGAVDGEVQYVDAGRPRPGRSAVTRSAVEQPSSRGSGAVQHAL